jgi:hypothetical protein
VIAYGKFQTVGHLGDSDVVTTRRWHRDFPDMPDGWKSPSAITRPATFARFSSSPSLSTITISPPSLPSYLQLEVRLNIGLWVLEMPSWDNGTSRAVFVGGRTPFSLYSKVKKEAGSGPETDDSDEDSMREKALLVRF